MKTKLSRAFTLVLLPSLFFFAPQSVDATTISKDAQSFGGLQTIASYSNFQSAGSVQSDELQEPTPTVQSVTDIEEARKSTTIGGDPRDCQTCHGCDRCPCPDNYLSGSSAIGISEGNLRDAYQVIRLRSVFGATLDLSLQYNSYNADGSRAAINTVMGYGWTHSYNVFLFQQSGHMFRMGGDGRVTRYERNRSGTFTAAPGYFETLVQTSATTFTITTKEQTVFSFALIPNTTFAIGGQVYRLTRIVDRNFRVTNLSYTQGDLTKIIDTYGRQLTLAYDRRHRLVSVTDPLMRTTTLEYDSTGRQLVTITDPDYKRIQLSYNSLNQLTEKVEKDGRAFSYLYENLKPVAIIDGEGQQGSNGRPRTLFRLINAQNWATRAKSLEANQLRVYIPATTIVIDGRRNLWRHEYDRNGYITRTIAPDGATTNYIYDQETLMLASKTDANNHTTSYRYDAQGNLTSMIDALGHLTTYTYDPLYSQMTSVSDDKGRTTKYELDGRGNRIRETDPAGNTREWAYDSRGVPLSAEDKNGNLTFWGTDLFGNFVTITEGARTAVQRTTTLANDVVGNALSRTNGNGHTTEFEYDSLDRVIRETDPMGKVTQTFYDGMGNKTAVIDRNSNSAFFEYDHRQRLLKTTDALSHTTTRRYDNNNNLISMTDRNGHATRYVYDEQNRVISIVDALNNKTNYTYDDVGNKLTQTDVDNMEGGNSADAGSGSADRKQPSTPGLNITRFAYDNLDRTIQMTNAVGGVYRYRYDTGGPSDCPACTGPTPGSGLVTEQIDPNGNVTLFGFDDRDFLTVEVRKEGDRRRDRDASDAVTLREYDANGNTLFVRQPNGDTVTSVYNPLNQVVRWNNNAGNTITYTYDGAGNSLTVADRVSRFAEDENSGGTPDSCTNVTTNTYDALERLVRVDDRLGRIASYTYDNESNRLSETDGNGNRTHFRYDALDRLARVTDPLGERTRHEYDPEGNLIRAIDREGKITTNKFDDLNRRISTTKTLQAVNQNGAGGAGRQFLTTHWEYDHVGNVVKITDAKPNPGVTQFEYDAAFRVIREIYSDSRPIRTGRNRRQPTARVFTYDLVGKLKSRTDQKGQTTTYEYNDLDFLIKRDYPASSDDHMTYDLSGRLVSAARGGWLVTFAYDGAGRVTRSAQNGKVVNYVLDFPCRGRQLTYPSGQLVVERADLRNRKTIINDVGASSPSVPVAQYTYDTGNRVTRRTYRNGTSSTYTYNGNDWLLSLEHSRGPSRVAGFGYAYDKEGNKRFEEKRHDTARSETYTYDDLYRLTNYRVGLLSSSAPSPTPTPSAFPSPSFPPLTQTAYRLDEVGNWNSRVTDGLTETRQHNAVNELTSINGAALTYDDNGNLISDLFFTYAYDEENRLVRVTQKGNLGAGARVVAIYDYDALGRRVAKIANPFTHAVRTEYVYDDNRIIEEQDRAGVTQATYIYGNYIDEILRMNRGTQTYFYHQNGLWSVAAVTDGAANIVERYAYDAYGGARITNAAGNALRSSYIGNPWMFTGRQLDEETGLYFYRARYLDPEKGRFITRDPIGVWGDPGNLGNAYSYVGNNPLANLDPTGTMAKCSGGYGWWRSYTVDLGCSCMGGQCVQKTAHKPSFSCSWHIDEVVGCTPGLISIGGGRTVYDVERFSLNGQTSMSATIHGSPNSKIVTGSSMPIENAQPQTEYRMSQAGTSSSCRFSPMAPGCPLHIGTMYPSAGTPREHSSSFSMKRARAGGSKLKKCGASTQKGDYCCATGNGQCQVAIGNGLFYRVMEGGPYDKGTCDCVAKK